MLVCTSILWALMQLSFAHLESRQPCALISITPGGSMVSATCKTLDGQHIWNVARRSYRNLHWQILFCTSLEQGWFLVWRKVRGVLVLGQGFYQGKGVSSEEGLMQLNPAHPQTLHSSMLSSSLTVQNAMMTSSTSSSESGQQRHLRALLYMPASGASAWYVTMGPHVGPLQAQLWFFQPCSPWQGLGSE